MAKINYLILLTTLLFSLNSFSQDIRNVRISQEGTSVLVMYDLIGKPAPYNVSLFYTIDDGKTWQGPLKQVSGDISAQMPDKDKKVFWNAAVEKGQMEGYIQFKLFAEMSESGLPNIKAETGTYSPEYYKYKKSKSIWLISTLVGITVGSYSYLQAEDYYKQYQTATTDAADLHQKVKLYDQITPVAFGIAGLCALEFILKAGKQSKAKKQSISFYPQPIKNGAGIGLAYTF